MVGGVMTPPYVEGGSLDRCGIGLTSLLLIGLAPAFLIRRFAPPSPRGKAFRCGGERRMANGERPDRRQWREEGGERLAPAGAVQASNRPKGGT